jgi:transposase
MPAKRHRAGDLTAQQIVLRECIDAGARVARLTGQIAALLPGRSLAPVVDAVRAMRGVGVIVAGTGVAGVGDFRRFDTLGQPMAWLGLTPPEHSGGASVWRGGIIRAEAVWKLCG